jgi:hypothetical protein
MEFKTQYSKRTNAKKETFYVIKFKEGSETIVDEQTGLYIKGLELLLSETNHKLVTTCLRINQSIKAL